MLQLLCIQPKLLQIAVWKAAAVVVPLVWNCPVRMVREAITIAFSRLEEIRKIMAISMMPNSSIRNGMVTSAISTAAAPPSEGMARRIRRRSRVLLVARAWNIRPE